jgi:hypothetical protein
MDQTESYSVEAYRFPLSVEDHNEITRMLSERRVFAPSFVPQHDADVYDPLVYRREAHQHDTATILLADRNVVTRWLALLSGRTASPQDRLAAAIMVFAQLANILVEPNLALYEATVTGESETTKEELVQFRIADNLDIKHWADLARGRKHKLTITAMSYQLSLIDLRKSISRCAYDAGVRNYIILLKLAELELKGLNRIRQITELATWMYQDFVIGGPALMFAIHYLAPNSERNGLLKNLRSADRERALRGIRNASWDVTLLSEWIRRAGEQRQTNILTLLCSLDRKLVDLARMLAPKLVGNLTDEESRRAGFMKILEPWGEQAGQIAKLLGGFFVTKDNPSRQIHRPAEVDLDQMIQAGEKFVRDWQV